MRSRGPGLDLSHCQRCLILPTRYRANLWDELVVLEQCNIVNRLECLIRARQSTGAEPLKIIYYY